MTEDEESTLGGFRWKNSYWYMILLTFTIVMFIFNRELMEIPRWSGIGFFLFLMYTALEQSWEAWKRRGMACITTLSLDSGGHSSIHPHDVRTAIQTDEKGKRMRAFTVFATGGFIYGGLEWQGADAFFVCPPEFIRYMDSAMICTAFFRPKSFDKMPGFVQDELRQLKFFDEKTIKVKKTLYFATVGKFDGTATAKALDAEDLYTENEGQITKYKEIIKEQNERIAEKQKMGTGDVVISKDLLDIMKKMSSNE